MTRGISGLVVIGIALMAAAIAHGGDPCAGALNVSPTTIQFNANGGQLTTFTVTAPPTCGWFFKYQSGDVIFTTTPPGGNSFYLGTVTFGPPADIADPGYCDAAGLCGIVNHLARALTGQGLIESVAAGGYVGGTITANQDPALTASVPCPLSPPIYGIPICGGHVGVPFSLSTVASGGKPPYVFSTSRANFPTGALSPASLGLTFNTSTGVLSGTPTAAGSLLPSGVYVGDADGAIVQAPGNVVIGGSCNSAIQGPSDVPGLSQYTYAIDSAATGISWTVDKATASFSGATNLTQAIVQFQNTRADYVTITANFTLNGSSQCATKQIALVKVDVGTPTFTTSGKPSVSGTGTRVFLVYPPVLPPPPPPAMCAGAVINPAHNPPPTVRGSFWITTLDPTQANPNPGKNWNCFTDNVTPQPAEPRQFILSMTAGGPQAFVAKADVTLTSPAQKPNAHQNIQVGFIQHGSDSGGAALYPHNLTRVLNEPTSTAANPILAALDWVYLSPPPPGSPPGTLPTKGANDIWPWYNGPGVNMAGCGSAATVTGSGASPWKGSLCMSDSPGLSLPAQYNPNDPTDPFRGVRLTSGRDNFDFAIQMAVRTTDSDLNADTHYFDEADSSWSVHFHWPVSPGLGIAFSGPPWAIPASPSEIDVNVVPTAIDHNDPFRRWKCATASCYD
jgi:hypothetical protein